MPNAIAQAMLLVWPVVAWAMFRRWPVERAFVWCMLGGYLLLPPATVFNIPLLPDIDKTTMPTLCALAGCLFVARRRLSLIPSSWAARILCLVFVLGAIPTALTNTDAIPFQAIRHAAPIDTAFAELPGLGLKDMMSIIMEKTILLLPFLMAQDLLAGERGRRELLTGLVIGAVIYTLPALVEIRFSPQFNIWIYGFFQHDFQQMIRSGGFRPIVFLEHALWLAFFLVSAALAAAGLAQLAEGRQRRRYLLATGWLVLVILVAKSLAATMYALLLVPFVMVTRERARLWLSLVFVLLALLYPTLRNSDAVPLDALVAVAERVNVDRAQSLEYRFDNEEALLAHAQEKPLFGWGGWGRNLVRDPDTGESATISDGRWIIVLGMYGIVGFVAEFGLLALPVFLVWARSRRGAVAPAVGTAALILALTMMDMLINAPIVAYVWMLAGAVLGHAQVRAAEARKAAWPGGRRAMIGSPHRPGTRGAVIGR